MSTLGSLSETETAGTYGTTTAEALRMTRVSWGAIFAGVVVALIVQVLLTMLGVGIGVANLNPAAGDNPAASSFSIAAGIWYVVTGLIAAFAGGYIAARMSGRSEATTGALHGLTTWAFTTLLVLYLLTSTIGSLVGGAFSGVASAIGGTGKTLVQAAAPMLANSNPLDALSSQIQATGTSPDALNAAAVNAMRGLVMGDQKNADAARTQAAQALSKARGIPLEQATQQVTDMEKQYHAAIDSAKQQATEAAATTASVVSTGAILAFIALVLGAVAGWLGGRSGVVHPIYAERIVPSRRA